MDRVVVALGGNALLRRGEEDTFENMYRSARLAAERMADIAAAGWEVVVTHGNGPQVGRILLQQEASRRWIHPMPLDVCGAQSQGQIGYLLQVTIGDVFYERGQERPVTTVLTLTRVPVGVIVIAAGGGGVPVTEQGPRLIGVEGVVDKDLAAAILARDVQASTLLILTDVRRVQRGFGTENATDIDRLTVTKARELLVAGEFDAGSMGPKITAGIEFVEGGGIRAAIGDLDDAVAVLDGSAGTTIVAS